MRIPAFLPMEVSVKKLFQKTRPPALELGSQYGGGSGRTAAGGAFVSPIYARPHWLGVLTGASTAAWKWLARTIKIGSKLDKRQQKHSNHDTPWRIRAWDGPSYRATLSHSSSLLRVSWLSFDGVFGAG